MKIVNSIMPMSDVEALAANGQKLRVAVTKTSAQGKTAQSATPNLMSFSTDENSVWFNGKRFGVISLGESFLTLTTSSNASTITTALNGFTKEQWEDAFNRGFIAVVKGEAPSIGMIYYYGSGGKKYLSISLISIDYSSLTSVDIEVGDSDENYKCTQVATNSLLTESRIVNALNNTSTTSPLSAAMGKKLQDEKLAKTDVVNNLTTTDTSKALSAAQGKALNDKFNGNKININFSVTSNSTDNATIKGYMGNIDGTTLVNKLTYGANLVDSSSEDWVITLQEVSATKVSFTGIRFAGFKLYGKNVSITISGSNYTNMTVAQGSRFVPAINNTLTSTSTGEALSAAQGKALNDKISGLGNVYRVKGTKSIIEEVYDISADAKLGDVWNITSAFTIGGKPYPANTNVVCIAEWSTSTTPQNNWDPLGGTVNLSTYVPKSDIVDNTISSDTNKPLSANQGRLLGARLDELEVKTGLYKLLKPFTSGTLGSKTEVDSLLGAYSTFSSAVTTGKLIYGIYNDSNSLTHTVTFTAYNSTVKKQVIMYAVINPTTMVRISADYGGTNWVTATIEQGAIGGGTIIE